MMGSIITKRKLLSAVNPVFDSIEDDEIKTWLSLTISSLQKDFGSYELGKHQILQTSKRLQDNKTFQEQFGFLNMTAKILVDFGLIDEMKDILAILPLKEIRNDVVCASVNIVDIEQIWLSVIDQLLNLNKLNDVKIIVQNMNDQCISGSAKQFMNVVAGLYLSNEREIAQEFFKKNIYFFQSFGFTVTIFIAMKFADFGLFTLAGFLSTAEKESNDQILYDWTLAYIEAKKKNFTLVRELIEKYSFGEELPDTITHYNYCDLIVMLLKIGEIFEQNEKELAKKVNIF
ncbi:MAG: hypothetical protein HOD92_20640, partial [Deltaproteobacteria bacterium]|nr:hypothetical protein [Deltaproteobacteria bacterium]